MRPRGPGEVRFAHHDHDHVHIDLDPTPERLTAAVGRFTHNRFEDANAIYLMGHPDDLIAKFQARIDARVEEITFNFLTLTPLS